MKKKLSFYFCFYGILFLFNACAAPTQGTEKEHLSLVATTTMLQDLATIIGGEEIEVIGLMAVGIDPHLYQPSARDSSTLENADVILYHGLHLEGELGDLLSRMGELDKFLICAGDAVATEQLLTDPDSPSVVDPHIWFDLHLWSQVAEHLAEKLGEKDPDNAAIYQERAQDYVQELLALEEELEALLADIPPSSRILITAHDAFQYLGFDFQVVGLQGIATNSEATTADLQHLADFIVEQEIKAIFVESSVSSKNMEALQEAVAAQGFSVEIGGELYSDSLGNPPDDSYINSFRSNITTIVAGLS